MPPLVQAAESTGSDASIVLDCSGSTSESKIAPTFASGGEARFAVTATFGDGATVALIDPGTSKVLRPLYDSETTIGQLRFGGGEETTIVWTRMSGADGALMGDAIMSDGDVLALTIGQGSNGTERPFTLFAAASGSLIRGTCVRVPPR